MKLIIVDTETFYDPEYTLSKMTTEEYIRDERFEIIGLAVKVGSAPAEWFSGTHDETREWLAKFKLEENFVVAHNAMFDMAILTWVLGVRPKVIGDTLSMARALYGPSQGVSLAALAKKHGLQEKGTEVVNALGKRRADFSPEQLERYAEYCRTDTDICHDLFNLFMTEGEFPKGELAVIDATIKMFSDPVLELDRPLLEEHLQKVREKKAVLMSRIDAERDTLMSNPKFAALLMSLGVSPPTKLSPTTGKQTWAFSKADEGFKELADHPDTAVQALVAARLGVKSTLEETRTERFIGISKRGKFPVPLSYAVAISHRWGGTDSVNLQNLPSRGKGVNTLKRAIKAPEGYVVIDCDSSQIEARVLAWLAKQEDLADEFEAQDNYRGDPANKPDVYKTMAARIYGKAPQEIIKEERDVGKATVLGAGYGMAAPKFLMTAKSQGITLSEQESSRIIDTYRLYNAQIVAFWYHCGQVLDKMFMGQSCMVGRTGAVWAEDGGIYLPNGLRIRYPNLRKDPVRNSKGGYVYDARRGMVSTIYSTKLVENICQAVARCIIAEQLAKISRRYRAVLTVHDAIACIAPIAEAEEAVKYVERVMRTAPSWAKGLPLNCESGYGATYGDC